MSSGAYRHATAGIFEASVEDARPGRLTHMGGSGRESTSSATRTANEFCDATEPPGGPDLHDWVGSVSFNGKPIRSGPPLRIHARRAEPNLIPRLYI
jgi:hypothetical protein